MVYMANSPDERTLLAECYHIEAVKAVGSAIPEGQGCLMDKQWLHEIEEMAAEYTSYPSGIEVEEAIWRSIIADRTVGK